MLLLLHYYYILMKPIIPLILSEVTEEERARWLRMLIIIALGGLLIIFAPDIIRFMTGIVIPVPPPSQASCPSGSVHSATGLPCDTVRALSQIFVLARYLGVVAVAAGGGFAVFKL
jgi:predicted membrane channel-forming protein YqfA (hemolysin III family)